MKRLAFVRNVRLHALIALEQHALYEWQHFWYGVAVGRNWGLGVLIRRRKPRFEATTEIPA